MTSEYGTVDRSKAVVLEYFRRLFEQRDLTVLDDLLAADYVDHDSPPDAPAGAAATRKFVSAFLGEYPDMSVTIDDILAEDDRVAVRAIWRGINARSGSEYHQMGIVIFRLNADGRLRERWSAYSPVPVADDPVIEG
jgi:predicted SnoaL-like aldol condensation-catalyzing enzyme